MLISTVDIAQHCHIIGYGICGNEDEEAHEYITKCLKTEVERLVERHRVEQQPI